MLTPNPSNDSFDILLKEAAHESSLLLPGTQLLGGRFILQKLLGSGGMGVVYEATDVHLDKRVVIKTLSSVSSEGVYRLKKEFRSLANVIHPHLVGLHELFVDGEISFFSMDRVPGETLSRYLGSSPCFERVQTVFAELAEGIDAIHSAGKLHRDLKPNNVMVTPAHRVVILDFGLVCDQSSDDPMQTIGNEFSGTPTYMAPEQVVGLPATRGTDWYAFGVMLYEVLAGHPPFNGASQAIMIEKSHKSAPGLHPKRGDVGDEVCRLCMDLLSRYPDKRPDFETIQRLFPCKDKKTASSTSLFAFEKTFFIGRNKHLTELLQMLAETNKGRPTAALVSGVSGIGKSALLKEFAHRNTQSANAVVLTGRCYERETIPYKGCDALLDSVSRYLMRLPVERAVNLLPRQVHALCRVFPVFGRIEAVRQITSRIPLPPDPVELKRRGEAALKELFCRLAEQEQVVLIVDDFQWSDEDGARLITSLITAPDAPPVMWLIAFRNEDTASCGGLTELLNALEKQDEILCRHIQLLPLSNEDSEKLTRRLLSHRCQSAAESIVTQSHGSPFLITMLSQHINTGQSKQCCNVSNALKTSTAALDDDALEVLEAVCISGRALDLQMLQQITDSTDISSAIRQLSSQRLIRSNGESPESVSVYHDQIGAAFLKGLRAEKVKNWHNRFAEAIETRPGGKPDPVALTYHHLGAGNTRLAGRFAIVGARTAEAALAFDQAATLYDIALAYGELQGRELVDIHTKKAEALANGLCASEAGDAYLSASKVAPSDAERDTLKRKGGEQLLISGRLNEGIHIIKDALGEHGLDYDTLISSNCDELYAALHSRGFGFTRREETSISKEQLRRLDTLWCACLGLSHLQYKETFALSLLYAAEALALGVTSHIIRGFVGVSVFESTLMTESADAFCFLKRLCNEEDSPLSALYLALTEANIALFHSNPQALKRAAARSLKLITESVGLTGELFMARTLMIIAHHKTGDFDRLARDGRMWLIETERQQNKHLSTWISIYLVVYYLAKGAPSKARNMLDRATAYFDGTPPEIVNIAINQHSALCDAFEGKTEGLSRIRSLDSVFSRSTLADNPLKRNDHAYFKGLVILRLIGDGPDSTALLEEVEMSAQFLDGLTVPGNRLISFDYWRPHAALFRAGIAAQKGDMRRVAAELDASLELFKSANASESGKAVVMIRKGELIGGKPGRALVHEGQSILGRMGIVDMERYVDLFAPVFF